jgi:hypothetical protein
VSSILAGRAYAYAHRAAEFSVTVRQCSESSETPTYDVLMSSVKIAVLVLAQIGAVSAGICCDKWVQRGKHYIYIRFRKFTDSDVITHAARLI